MKVGAVLARSLAAASLPISIASAVSATHINQSILAALLSSSANQNPIKNDGTKGHHLPADAASPASSKGTSRNMTAMRDEQYPGTAVERMMNARERVRQLAETGELSGQPWDDVRRQILWAGGLKDLTNVRPGQGYTGHSFNDFNHVDLTCMMELDNTHDGRSIPGIAPGNKLGQGIRVASLPELGPGGSWSTCAMGCNTDPPNDVAHTQFKSRIAFKLVWVPTRQCDEFVLVDDDGQLLAHVTNIQPPLPSLRERQMNYRIVEGSKYAKQADRIAGTYRMAVE
jgi:hypothetical protein